MADLVAIDLKNKLDEIQQMYDTNRKRYEAWLSENREIEGTTDYVNYCRQFGEWEETILKRIKSITEQYEQALAKSFAVRTAEKTIVISPAEIDIELRNLVHTIKPIDFMMAIINYGHADPQFLNRVVQIVNSIDTQRNIKMGNNQKQHPLVNGLFFSSSGEGYTPQNTGYRVEPAIKKPTYVPPPQKQYTMGNIMPFSDFSRH
uniref:Phage protein n=1 Tax=Parastrongyloides trichosuri TaxID=131310 RepID=A0A0N4ZKH0_PARTI